MKTVHIHSLPVLEVISDLALAFDTIIISEFNQHTLTLPPTLGSGTISAFVLSNGLSVIEYNCTFFMDIEIMFVVDKVHPLKFIYVTNGNLKHRFQNENTLHSIQEYQSSIVASSANFGHILNFSVDTSVAVFSLEIDRKIFDFNGAYNSPDINKTIKDLFQDEFAASSFYYKGNYSLNIADVFNEIVDFEGDSFLRKLFMEAIVYKTLMLHIAQFLDDLDGDESQTILRKSEFIRIKNAATYIVDNLETYKGIDELKKETGLNALKLQNGFKHLFKSTINNYVQEIRLQKAKDLLQYGDNNIGEIVNAIGLTSNSYFSRIFKEQYGVSPSHFRNEKSGVFK